MSISSIGGTAQSYLSQLTAAQQTSAYVAASVQPDSDGVDDSLSTAASNSLTGSSSASLDSQTLQALLGITQDDGNATSGTQSASTPAQGAHHHHRHHGGPPPASQQDSGTTTAAASTAAAADSGVAAGSDIDQGDLAASLTA